MKSLFGLAFLFLLPSSTGWTAPLACMLSSSGSNGAPICDEKAQTEMEKVGDSINSAALSSMNISESKPLTKEERWQNELAWQQEIIDHRLGSFDDILNQQKRNFGKLQNKYSAESKKREEVLTEYLDLMNLRKAPNRIVQWCSKKGCNYKSYLNHLERLNPNDFDQALDNAISITRNGRCRKLSIEGRRDSQKCSIENFVSNLQKVRSLDLQKKALREVHPFLDKAEEELTREAKASKSWKFSRQKLRNMAYSLSWKNNKNLNSRLLQEKAALQKLAKSTENAMKKLKEYDPSRTNSGQGYKSGDTFYTTLVKSQQQKLVDISRNGSGFLNGYLGAQDGWEEFRNYGEGYCSAHKAYSELLAKQDPYVDEYLFIVPGVSLLEPYREREACKTLDFRYALTPSKQALNQKQTCWNAWYSDLKFAMAGALGGPVGAVAKASGKAKRVLKLGERIVENERRANITHVFNGILDGDQVKLTVNGVVHEAKINQDRDGFLNAVISGENVKGGLQIIKWKPGEFDPNDLEGVSKIEVVSKRIGTSADLGGSPNVAFSQRIIDGANNSWKTIDQAVGLRKAKSGDIVTFTFKGIEQIAEIRKGSTQGGKYIEVVGPKGDRELLYFEGKYQDKLYDLTNIRILPKSKREEYQRIARINLLNLKGGDSADIEFDGVRQSPIIVENNGSPYVKVFDQNQWEHTIYLKDPTALNRLVIWETRPNIHRRANRRGRNGQSRPQSRPIHQNR